MIISLVNRSNLLSHAEVLPAIRAINRQIKEDFDPYWSLSATLRLEGAVGAQADKASLADMRGDAVIYLADKADVTEALGYHEANFRGIPYGFVFLELCKQLKESWTVTLSHETLELLGDAQGNLLVQGPHPTTPTKTVFHWFEMCDAVQSQIYTIDGIEVSNFVLPLYFTPDEQEGGRNDFLGALHKGKSLASFGVSPGSYIGFYDPDTQQHTTYNAAEDKKARRRVELKASKRVGRGYTRKASLAKAMAATKADPVRSKALRKAQSAPNADPIQHVVVLMLENRSFDHLLGDATKIYPHLEGIPQTGEKFSNRSAKGSLYKQSANAAASVGKDLPHEHVNVLQQMGQSNGTAMGGFVDEYIKAAALDESKAADCEQIQQVMAYFPMGAQAQDDSLPALHSLARNFLLCDHWFSSMPGPTWQNRFFVHSGTCNGHVLMPSRQHPEDLKLYDQDTVYDRLSAANKTWRIYHDGMPQSIVMSHMWLKYGISLLTDSYAAMADFFTDAKGKPEQFPQYVFIEPCYFGEQENDQHPPSDIGKGDKLIADVYNALRSNPALWESTLLIVTYDEHGGFFDHVPPPATIAPDGKVAEYDFARLGVRVPTILVSPWVEKSVCSTVFDHTSILRYVCEKWSLPSLSRRMDESAGTRRCNSFANALKKLQTPRADTPLRIANRAMEPVPRARKLAASPPIDGSHEALLCFLASLPDAKAAKTVKGMKLGKTKPAVKQKSVQQLGDAQLLERAEQRFAQLMDTR